MTKLEHFMRLIARDLGARKLTPDDVLRMILHEAPEADTEEGKALLDVLRYLAQYRTVEKASEAVEMSFDKLELWSDALAVHEDGDTAARQCVSKLEEESRRQNDLLRAIAAQTIAETAPPSRVGLKFYIKSNGDLVVPAARLSDKIRQAVEDGRIDPEKLASGLGKGTFAGPELAIVEKSLGDWIFDKLNAKKAGDDA